MKQVSDHETSSLLNLAAQCLTVPGDFVEFGCYAGDTSILLADLLPKSKKLWLYDSFEGLPNKTAADESVAGKNFTAGALAVTKREVKLRFLHSGLPVPIIKKAWFSDLTPADLPDQIAFAFLDGDLYQSICDSLRLIEGKLSPASLVLVHDYNNPELPGVTQAVEEWLSRHPTYHLRQIDTLAIITRS